MKVTRFSVFTGKYNEMELEITEKQLREINLPKLQRRTIQEIVPNLTTEEREFLITGLSLEEQKEFYSNFEE